MGDLAHGVTLAIRNPDARAGEDNPCREVPRRVNLVNVPCNVSQPHGVAGRLICYQEVHAIKGKVLGKRTHCQSGCDLRRDKSE